ncbi:unnamed protein product [Fusarium graminearum]|nr:hypothetical protein FG05_06872 [Fusarium graminearum]CZS72604.1 unnamed protein product [Fusarium graminearum]
MPSATLASTGDGATVPIHTTMAQPLLFSNSGRNVEPIRRRMARRGMRVASEAYTVPMQQPMPRLNKELGHKVVDKERYGYGCLCGCACEKMDGTKEPKAHDRASSVACASVHKSHVLPLVSLFVLSVTFFLLLVGLCTRVPPASGVLENTRLTLSYAMTLAKARHGALLLATSSLPIAGWHANRKPRHKGCIIPLNDRVVMKIGHVQNGSWPCTTPNCPLGIALCTASVHYTVVGADMHASIRRAVSCHIHPMHGLFNLLITSKRPLADTRLCGASDVTRPIPSHLLIALRPKLEATCGDDELRRAVVGQMGGLRLTESTLEAKLGLIVYSLPTSKQTMLEYQWPMKKSNFHVGHQGPKLINDKYSKAYSTSTKNIALLPALRAVRPSIIVRQLWREIVDDLLRMALQLYDDERAGLLLVILVTLDFKG